MRTTKKLIGPVVIAGVGGSGTRVVAKIVSELAGVQRFLLSDTSINFVY
ncbi:MAG: hypothetical protein ACFFBD_26840 [Candidatus Hodarchaeota archaeon]